MKSSLIYPIQTKKAKISTAKLYMKDIRLGDATEFGLRPIFVLMTHLCVP